MTDSESVADAAEVDGDLLPSRRSIHHHVDWRLAATIVIGLTGGLLLADLLGAVVARVQSLLVMLLISLFLSFAMEPAVQWMARRGIRRGMGTGLVFIALFVLIIGFVAAMAPLVIDQVSTLVRQGPDVLRGLEEQAQRLPGNLSDSVVNWLQDLRQELPSRLPSLAGTLGREAAALGSTLLGGIFQTLTIALVTFYLVADGPRLRRTLSSRLRPDTQRDFLRTWELAVGKTGGYVYSRLLTAVASAAFHFVAFLVIGVEYAAALAVWVGLLSSLIPVVGTYLAGALPLLIALADEPIKALWVLVAIGVYQQVENYLIAPRITARTMELHPAVAFVSVLIGGSLLGAPGALLALPAAAIVTALISAYGERHEVVAHGLVEGEQARQGDEELDVSPPPADEPRP